MGFVPHLTLCLKVGDIKTLPVHVTVWNNWPERIPKVAAAARPDWLRTGDDWHISRRELQICCEFKEMWKQHFAKLREYLSEEQLGQCAAEWIVNSTEYLLQVHWSCHLHGRKNWPEMVDFWAHKEEDATKQLKRLQKLKLVS